MRRLRVAVLGSNSFAGSDFVELLLSEQRFDILGISRSRERPAAFLPSARRTPERFTSHQFDINRQLEGMTTSILSFQPQFVVNFVAQGEDAASWAHPADFFQTNCVALASLIDGLKDSPSIKGFLHVSSSGVYGNPVSAITEASPLRPESPYSASKAAADLLLLAYAKSFGFPAQIVRPPNLYGPYQQLFRIIPKTMISLKRGVPLELHGGGRSARPYLHVRDASRAMLTILECGRVGETYNVGPNDLIRIRDVVATICLILGKDFEASTIDGPDRRNQPDIAAFDSSKIRRELDWMPRIPFGEGLQEIADWIEREWHHLAGHDLAYAHIR